MRLDFLKISSLMRNSRGHYLKLFYLGLSGLGGLSMKLLFVTFEMGTDGTFFNDGVGAKGGKGKSQFIHFLII